MKNLHSSNEREASGRDPNACFRSQEAEDSRVASRHIHYCSSTSSRRTYNSTEACSSFPTNRSCSAGAQTSS